LGWRQRNDPDLSEKFFAEGKSKIQSLTLFKCTLLVTQVKNAPEQASAVVKRLLDEDSGVVSPSPAWAIPISSTDTKSPGVAGIKSHTVKLRDHPLMNRSSAASWPPQWQCVGDDRGVVLGERGVLEDVSMHELVNNKIFIAMDHLSERYIAVLAFDDEMFVRQLYSLLVNHIGRCIHEIGDLDLPLP
jgi:hypothetical protein